jgi:hypothetical protein
MQVSGTVFLSLAASSALAASASSVANRLCGRRVARIRHNREAFDLGPEAIGHHPEDQPLDLQLAAERQRPRRQVLGFRQVAGATTPFTTGICRGVMEKSLSPSPRRIQVNAGSPAMSPHKDTGLFALRAASMICLSERRTAGCSG